MHDTEPEPVSRPTSEEYQYIDYHRATLIATILAWRDGERFQRSIQMKSPELTTHQKNKPLKLFV